MLLGVPIAAVALSFWPGHLSADSLTQISQVQNGEFTNHHSPLLLVLWRPLHLHLGAGPGWILTGQVLAFVLGSYLVLRAAYRPIGAAVATAVVCFLPPVFGMLGYVGRDTWFTALLVLTFGLSVRATMVRGPIRWAWIAAAVLAAWLTLASRQNAAAAVAIACVVLVALALGEWREHRSKSRAWGGWKGQLLIATAGGVALTLTLMASQIGVSAFIDARDANPDQYIYIYDLAALSHRERQNLFPPEVMPARGMDPIDAYWNIDSVRGYVFSTPAPIATPLPKEGYAALREGWLDAVGENPTDYLDARLDLFVRQLAIGPPARWTYHPRIDPNSFGYIIKFPEPNGVARGYVERFADADLNGNWIYSIWAYALLALASVVVLLRPSRRFALVVAGSLALAVLTYQVGLFFGAMVAEYRFEFPVVVGGTLGAAILIRLAWDHRPRAGIAS